MFRSIFAALILTLAAWHSVQAQPATWNYSAPNNVATATYPGDVVISGTCYGCGPGSSISLTNPQTWTALQTFSPAGISAALATFGGATSFGGTATFNSTSTLSVLADNIAEAATLTASAPAATTNFDVLTQSVQLYTSNAANNWTLNIRGSASVSLNSLMATGQAITVVMATTQGGTGFYNSALQIDGVSVTPKWQGGVAPVLGNINGNDVYTYTILKTGSAAWIVWATQVQFK